MYDVNYPPSTGDTYCSFSRGTFACRSGGEHVLLRIEPPFTPTAPLSRFGIVHSPSINARKYGVPFHKRGNLCGILLERYKMSSTFYLPLMTLPMWCHVNRPGFTSIACILREELVNKELLTFVSGASTILNLLTISMRAIFASNRANLIPMQLLGPCPKGM